MNTKKLEFGSDDHLTVLGAPWHLYLLTGKDREDMLEFGRACMAAAEDRRPALKDEQIDAIAESMERGPSWDLRQFARAVERAMGPTLGVADTDMPFLAAQKMAAENKRLNEAIDMMQPLLRAAKDSIADAARYEWLRQADSDDLERIHDDACRNLLSGDALDAAIDARIAQLNKETQG